VVIGVEGTIKYCDVVIDSIVEDKMGSLVLDSIVDEGTRI
jgi:hypothetical protein